MDTHRGHRERLRARFRETQLNGFAPHEVLELLLSYSIPQKDLNSLAHDLIDRFGSVELVLSAAPEELEKVPGIGEYSSTLISLVAYVAGYYQMERYRNRPAINVMHSMGGFCTTLFMNAARESMYLVGMDIHGRLLGKSLICMGPMSQSNMRDIVNAALQMNAADVVLAHNHTDSPLQPDAEDIEFTYGALNALRTIGIELLDHIIVGDDMYYSMTAAGILYGDVEQWPADSALRRYMYDGGMPPAP